MNLIFYFNFTSINMNLIFYFNFTSTYMNLNFYFDITSIYMNLNFYFNITSIYMNLIFYFNITSIYMNLIFYFNLTSIYMNLIFYFSYLLYTRVPFKAGERGPLSWLTDWLIVWLSLFPPHLKSYILQMKLTKQYKWSNKNKDIQLEHIYKQIKVSDFRYSITQYNI